MHNKSHKYFLGTKNFSHAHKPAVGILVLNLGTPDQPTPSAVRVYLREFLNDPRIIEVPKLLWFFLLNFIVLPLRPFKVSKLYQSIWTNVGAPLLVISKSISEKLENRLKKEYSNPVHVELGMRYGNPHLSQALRNLKEKGCTKIIVLPLFGQYSATTVGSAVDGVFDELKKWRWIPELRTINQFHDHLGYINSICENIKNHWQKHGKAEKLIFSFHGMPKRYILAGDPYHCHCHKTARLVVENLGLQEGEYQVCFQSQFGKEEWIKPATDKTIEALAKNGLKSLDVICPGFIADCLETLEEIEEQNKEIFLENGGETYHYIPAVNDNELFIDALADLIKENGHSWLFESSNWDQNKFEEEAQKTECRYQKMINK